MLKAILITPKWKLAVSEASKTGLPAFSDVALVVSLARPLHACLCVEVYLAGVIIIFLKLAIKSFDGKISKLQPCLIVDGSTADASFTLEFLIGK